MDEKGIGALNYYALTEHAFSDEDEAFDVLRRASQRENRKLRDVASDIVARAQHRRERGT